MAQAEDQLTHRQHLAIAEILASPSLEEARRRLKAGKDTFYGWLKGPAFKTELERQRRAIVDQAFNRLRAGLVQATDKLLELLQAGEQPSIQLRAAQTLLDHGLKAVELQDVADRLQTLEQWMTARQNERGVR